MKAGASKYTKEILKELVSKHINVADIIRELGLKVGGGTHSLICKRIKEFGIDTSHFKVGGVSSIFNRGHTLESFKKEVLCKNGKRWKTSAIKRKLFELGLKKERCEKCTGNNIWMGEFLSLQLDHINGDPTDNRLKNLRILCPNCHTQTKTYGTKKR